MSWLTAQLCAPTLMKAEKLKGLDTLFSWLRALCGWCGWDISNQPLERKRFTSDNLLECLGRYISKETCHFSKCVLPLPKLIIRQIAFREESSPDILLPLRSTTHSQTQPPLLPLSLLLLLLLPREPLLPPTVICTQRAIRQHDTSSPPFFNNPATYSVHSPSFTPHTVTEHPDIMAETHTYKFNVAMSCSGCSGAVDRVLKKLDGKRCHWPKPVLHQIQHTTLQIPAGSLILLRVPKQASSPTRSPSRARPPPSWPSPSSHTRRSSRPSPRRARRSTRARRTASRGASRCLLMLEA